MVLSLPVELRERVECGERYLAALQLEGLAAWHERVRSALRGETPGPETYALLHPQWAETWGRPLAEDLRGSRAFPADLRWDGGCQSHRIWGYKCPIVLPRHFAKDHHFPYSGGGVSSVSNLLWLCDRHNGVKTDDVHLYGDWHVVKPWVLRQLRKAEAAFRQL